MGLDRRRLSGVVGLTAVLIVALVVLDGPSLDDVRDAIAIESSADAVRSGVPADQISNCFQGFCFEEEAGTLDRWWSFSTTYLRLTWPGILAAVVAAAITEALLLPGRRPRRPSPSPTSALYLPALLFIVVAFSPLAFAVRAGLGVVALGATWLLSGRPTPSTWTEPAPVGEAIADTAAALWWYLRWLGPLFVLAAVVGGIVPQYLTEDGVSAVLGDHVLGIAVVAAVGMSLRLPPLFEIPLVAAAHLVGMGRVTSAVLLFTAALGGPLLLAVRARARVAVTVGLAAVSLGGGAAALGAATLIESATVPTIVSDGEACSYRGPRRFGPGAAEFVVRNDAADTGEGKTLAMVVGRLPDDVSMDHFELTVTADPTAPLPGWFTIAGNQEFVFPGTEVTAEVILHQAGRYAAVCLNGGGHYVIFEFSMPQPMGWFDEFRSTFDASVAPEVFTVAG